MAYGVLMLRNHMQYKTRAVRLCIHSFAGICDCETQTTLPIVGGSERSGNDVHADDINRRCDVGFDMQPGSFTAEALLPIPAATRKRQFMSDTMQWHIMCHMYHAYAQSECNLSAVLSCTHLAINPRTLWHASKQNVGAIRESNTGPFAP